MSELLPIEAALVRTARLRIISFEQTLTSFAEGDPERARIENKLSKERTALQERLRGANG